MGTIRKGVAFAFAAALLFGLSTPAAKLLLGAIDPWLLAGILYAGSGLGLALVEVRATVARGGGAKSETPLGRGDWPWLAGAIVSGGIVGPVLLMAGLAATTATASSLLLTLEGAATALIAWFVFRENFDQRIALGMLCIVAGAAVLSWRGTFSMEGFVGPLAIVGACVAWGIDNNLTRKVSLADPVQIAMYKGLAAGTINMVLASLNGAELPSLGTAAAAAVVGFLGYGVSLVFFVLALRDLGTARTGAYFSTAPFIGALAALLLPGETLSWQLLIAGALMSAGVWLHLTERHEHEHEHEPIEHEHAHVHDAHHQHAHRDGDPLGEPHSHRHVHVRLRHAHDHVPDSHHRHLH
jgi:drug/metabolite transporter (DMT)-like permease